MSVLKFCLKKKNPANKVEIKSLSRLESDGEKSGRSWVHFRVRT